MRSRLIKALAIVLFLGVLAGCDLWLAGVPDPATVPQASGYVHPNPDVERWHQTALEAGWAEAEWPVIACIMQHPGHPDIGESMGDPNVYNGRLSDRSYGLLQLNTKGSLWRWYANFGVNMRDDLRDPFTNLRMGKLLSDYNAAAPWARFDKWFPWRGSWSRYRAECFGMEGSS